VKLAIEAGCNAVASTFGGLAMLSRKYAHKIPFIVKINHNELLSYPTKYDQVLFGSVKDAWNMGAAAIGATIYFGSTQSKRQLVEIANAFEEAHELGLATIVWCYTRNESFVKEGLAVVNKRAGGSGLILGRKAFQRPFDEGIALLQLVQEVYLDKNISLA